MADIVDLIQNKDLIAAKTAILEKVQVVKAKKLLEMKKMVAAKMYVSESPEIRAIKSKALQDAFDKIDKSFGPGGTHTSAAIKKRTDEYRANHPEFNSWLKKVGKKNPYKKDET